MNAQTAITRREDKAVTEHSETVQASQQSPVMALIAAAMDKPDFNVETLERLVNMAERDTAKKAEIAFNAAMSAAQKEITRIGPDKTNDHTKSNYASYAQLDRILRPIYTKHGFSLSFDTGENPPDQHVRVLCHVSHEAGHTRTYRADIPCDGKGAQGKDVMTKTHAVGSAMSYGSRYLLKLIFNVAVGQDDDDGNLASGLDTITAEEIDELTDLLNRGHGDIEMFCEFMGVDAVANIRKRDIRKARKALNENLLAYEAAQKKKGAR